MKKYNNIVIFFCIFFVVLITLGNIALINSTKININKEYIIEINRLMDDLDVDNLSTLIDYEYIKEVDYAPISDIQATKDLLEGKNVSDKNDYTIRLVYEEDNIIGNVRIEYFVNVSFSSLIFMYNIGLIIPSLVVLYILLYIKYYILKPFNKISNLPIKLSQGILNDEIKESKNRFFGKFIWGLNVLRDSIAERKSRELELEREKKMMILSISHDIKTPLSSIKLYTKAIKDRLYNTESKKEKALIRILSATNQIEEFIQEIIKMSTTEIFDVEVEDSEFYLRDAIKLVKDNYKEKLEMIKTKFSINKFSNILLKGDLKRTNEVIENVIENAIKYGDGKTINISFSNEEDRQLIYITNTGEGLEEKEVIHMFDSFWRGSNSNNKPGSGLGLYICKQIMNKMNGEIYAKSSKEKMSVVLVITKI